MQSALHITAKVLSGNKIEIQVPEAAIGEIVDVFVILPEKPASKRHSVIEILKEIHSQRSPKSAEDIDRYLQEERELWDS